MIGFFSSSGFSFFGRRKRDKNIGNSRSVGRYHMYVFVVLCLKFIIFLFSFGVTVSQDYQNHFEANKFFQ